VELVRPPGDQQGSMRRSSQLHQQIVILQRNVLGNHQDQRRITKKLNMLQRKARQSLKLKIPRLQRRRRIMKETMILEESNLRMEIKLNKFENGSRG